MKYLIIYIYLFYICFVVYAGCQSAIINKKWSALIPVLPILLIAGLMDIVFNQIFGRILFLEWKYTLTFSERLDLHFHDMTWRGTLARDIGDYIDKILPMHIS